MKIEREATPAVRGDIAEGYRVSAAAEKEQDVQISYIVTLTPAEVRDALLSYIEENSELPAVAEGENARLVIGGSGYPDSTAGRLEWAVLDG